MNSDSDNLLNDIIEALNASVDAAIDKLGLVDDGEIQSKRDELLKAGVKAMALEFSSGGMKFLQFGGGVIGIYEPGKSPTSRGPLVGLVLSRHGEKGTKRAIVEVFLSPKSAPLLPPIGGERFRAGKMESSVWDAACGMDDEAINASMVEAVSVAGQLFGDVYAHVMTGTLDTDVDLGLVSETWHDKLGDSAEVSCTKVVDNNNVTLGYVIARQSTSDGAPADPSIPAGYVEEFAVHLDGNDVLPIDPAATRLESAFDSPAQRKTLPASYWKNPQKLVLHFASKLPGPKKIARVRGLSLSLDSLPRDDNSTWRAAMIGGQLSVNWGSADNNYPIGDSTPQFKQFEP